MAGQRRMVDKLWQQFFSDPSEWWDHRPEKVNEMVTIKMLSVVQGVNASFVGCGFS